MQPGNCTCNLAMINEFGDTFVEGIRRAGDVCVLITRALDR